MIEPAPDLEAAATRLVVIDNCGHSPQVEKPQAFLDAVLPFLSAP